MSKHEELQKKYDEEEKKYKNGEQVDKLGLFYMGQALNAVDYTKHAFGVELDFSEESLKTLEGILDRLEQRVKIEKPSDEQILLFSRAYAGYIGQVIIFKWGGK